MKTEYGVRIVHMWQRLHALPGGAWLFSRLLGFWVPYSGTLAARVLELSPGRVKLALRDRRRVRNHLNSVHAMALANLGEMASGLSLITALPPGILAIVTQLSIEYIKKARGRLIAEGRATAPATIVADIDHMVHAEIYDSSNEVVARVAVRWRLRPKTR